MAYEGDLLIYCPSDLNFTVTQAVVVSGASLNPCGHMLLCAGSNSQDAWYLHVAGIAGTTRGIHIPGVYGYPAFMREAGYRRYLMENKKHEIRRLDAQITNPSRAYARLLQLMANKWFWKVLPDNCASFVKEVVAAGGGNLTVLLNCPDQEYVRKVGTQLGGALHRVGEFQKQNPGPKW